MDGQYQRLDGKGQLWDGEKENGRKEGLSIKVDNVQRLSNSPMQKKYETTID